jgi:surface polysaccharide O-acyltransferase-like enzyme
MNPFEALVFFLFVLPVFMMKEGYKIFKKGMKERDWWWKIPYVLLIILVLILIVLLVSGY